MNKQHFIDQGFSVIGEPHQHPLYQFLKEHYPSVLKDNEINLQELKTLLGLPIDEKVNGYGLNFVGRNFARAKYTQKTTKELCLNTTLSQNRDTTQNLVLKGDNLDSLKILKSHYTGKIKCIYIDPPYNTTSDEFVYPDKFDKEEAQVLGLADLSEDEFDRMDFSFKTKKSHNGWLSFMYPRLLLARDLLSQDGVIFISIDDNEQANLKLLCDEIFGEENFVSQFLWNKTATPPSLSNDVRRKYEYILCYQKSNNRSNGLSAGKVEGGDMPLLNESNSERTLVFKKENVNFKFDGFFKKGNYDRVELLEDIEIKNGKANTDLKLKGKFKWVQSTVDDEIDNDTIFWVKTEKFAIRYERNKLRIKTPSNIINKNECNVGTNEDANKEIKSVFGQSTYFDFPKPSSLIRYLVNAVVFNDPDSIILDFFAGSGTTGHAVMQLNAEDGGNRKFILCQIDEPIDPKKPAHQFCKDHQLEPVISSITIERLKRAGQSIAQKIEEENTRRSTSGEDPKPMPDLGFKVFDSTEAPQLELNEEEIVFPKLSNDALSRIYNMIFTVGIDEPTQAPEVVVEDAIYKIGHHYYITNSHSLTPEQYAMAIKNGKVFIDGWTASLNGTMQSYKEEVKIVF
ncbi:site-specific DNA-methyltransferase [Riemerella anatipestifer]|uniref:site-specific DNA-methyltransferase n=1 Tax=Riemerella anatipestifer TaxID=34085 RepID=UPI00129DC495|nr:site-specific DNA-methyltransferase [Riemerella anatipestifer]MRM83263.1 site-specific DNA-methyltransferase [Riemerella anatipestifer]